MYDFQKFETNTSFGDTIYTGNLIQDEVKMVKFNNKSRPRSKEDNEILLIV